MTVPGGPRRLRMVVSYDGRPFQGWQSQAHHDTVQDRLEAAFAELCGGNRITVHGSGRTDAGVHARGQVAHVDVPDSWRHDPAQARAAVNAHLPPGIRVQQARFVSPAFHARFSARGKVYRYRVWNAPVSDPFEVGRAWHFPSELDDTILRQAALRVIGQHDFAGFAASRGRPEASTVRTIRRVDVRRHGPLLTLDFEGDGFLYKMVRLLTGSLVRCAQGRASLAWLDALLARHEKTSFAAPAAGLYLMRVLYKSARSRRAATESLPPGRRAMPRSRRTRRNHQHRILLHLEIHPGVQSHVAHHLGGRHAV